MSREKRHKTETAEAVAHDASPEAAYWIRELATERDALLEALEDLVHQVDRDNKPTWLDIDEAQLAIAKAYGEDQ